MRVTILIALHLASLLTLSDVNDEAKAQLFFRPGRIVRDLFNPADYRMSRRRRWQLQEEKRRAPPSAEVSPPEDVLGEPAIAVEVPEVNPAIEDRLRSYVRRGQCPRGLPAETMRRCLAMLAQALPKRQHPSARLIQRRARNVRQGERLGRETGIAVRLEKRLQLVRPRPRTAGRKNPRALQGEVGGE